MIPGVAFPPPVLSRAADHHKPLAPPPPRFPPWRLQVLVSVPVPSPGVLILEACRSSSHLTCGSRLSESSAPGTSRCHVYFSVWLFASASTCLFVVVVFLGFFLKFKLRHSWKGSAETNLLPWQQPGDAVSTATAVQPLLVKDEVMRLKVQTHCSYWAKTSSRSLVLEFYVLIEYISLLFLTSCWAF